MRGAWVVGLGLGLTVLHAAELQVAWPLKFLRPSEFAAWCAAPSLVPAGADYVLGPTPASPGVGAIKLPVGVAGLVGCDDLRLLLARGEPGGLAELAELVRLLDVEPRRVRLAVRCVRVPVAKVEELRRRLAPSETEPEVAQQAWLAAVLAAGEPDEVTDTLDTVNGRPARLKLRRTATVGGRRLLARTALSVVTHLGGVPGDFSLTVSLSVDNSELLGLEAEDVERLRPAGLWRGPVVQMRLPLGRPTILVSPTGDVAPAKAEDVPRLRALPLYGVNLLGASREFVELLVLTPTVLD